MPKLLDMSFDDLIKVIKSLKKKEIVITGRKGTGKTVIALKIAETLNPSFNIANNVNFIFNEFIIDEIRIKIYPKLTYGSIDELNSVGLWLESMYWFYNTNRIDTHINILNQERNFRLLNKYQSMIDSPSKKIYDEYKYQVMNFLNQIKDGIKGL